MASFLLEIITPERLAFSKEVDMVTVPTSRGTIGVEAHHVPLFSALTEGEVKISAENGTRETRKEFFLAIGGGFMEVMPKKVSVLVSRAYHAEELNEAEIKGAEEAARTIIAQRVKGAELANAQGILRRSLLEMKVLRRRRAPRPIS